MPLFLICHCSQKDHANLFQSPKFRARAALLRQGLHSEPEANARRVSALISITNMALEHIKIAPQLRQRIISEMFLRAKRMGRLDAVLEARVRKLAKQAPLDYTSSEVLDAVSKARITGLPEMRREVLRKHLKPKQVEAVERRFHYWVIEIFPAY